MKTLIKTTLALSLILSSLSASAELISTDWKVLGDSRSTLDSISGKEWLDITETDTMSIAQVSALLTTDYLGWRLPTASEVQALITNQFGVFGNGINTSLELATDWSSHFGKTSAIGQSYAMYELDGSSMMAGAFNGSSNAVFGNYLRGYDLTPIASSDGVFLVSDGGTTLTSLNNPSINAAANDVSSPEALGLLGLALMGVGFRRKLK